MISKKQIILLLILLMPFSMAQLDEEIIAYWNFQNGQDIGNGTHTITAQGQADFNSQGIIRKGTYQEVGMRDFYNVSTNNDDFNLGSNEITFNFWYNITGTVTSTHELFTKHTSGQADGYILDINESYHVRFIYDTTGTRVDGKTALTQNNWSMITLRTNSSSTCLFINANLDNCVSSESLDSSTSPFMIHSNYSNGGNQYIDEFGAWHKSITDNEISRLYNDGYGLAYPFNNVSVTLENPEDNQTVTDSPLNLSAVVRTNYQNHTLKNATLYLYDEYNTLVNNTNISITDSITTANFSISNLNPLNHTWNVYACSSNATETVCDMAKVNKTVIYGRNETGFTYPLSTSEATLELFEFNLTISPHMTLNSAILVFNNTAENPTINSLGNGKYNIQKTLLMPEVTATTNITHYWNYTINNINYTTTQQNTTLETLTVDDCSVNTQLILNYTLYDEDTRALLDNNTINTTIEVEVNIRSSGSDLTDNILINYSRLSNDNPTTVCMSDLGSSVYRLDAQSRYYDDENYVKEFNNLQNFTLKNSSVPQHIKLYDLLITSSQEFLITFKDENFLPVKDALISVQRKYIEIGQFITVENPITDNNGETLAHLVLGDVIYTIIVSKNGQTLGTFTNILPKCDDQSIGDCTIALNTFNSGTDPQDIEEVNGVSFQWLFNEASRIVSFVFSISGGSTATMSINGTLSDNYGNQTVCTDEQITSSGTLICNIPESFGNSTMLLRVFKDGEFVTQEYFVFGNLLTDTFGTKGVFTAILMSFILLITLPLMLITSTIGIMIGVIIGLVAIVSFNLVNSTGLLGTVSSVTWLIIAGGIIIFKITTRE